MILSKFTLKPTNKSKQGAKDKEPLVSRYSQHLLSLLKKAPRSKLRKQKKGGQKKKMSIACKNYIRFREVKRNWKGIIRTASRHLKHFRLLPKRSVFRNICSSFKVSKKNEHNFLKNQKSTRQIILKQVTKLAAPGG